MHQSPQGDYDSRMHGVSLFPNDTPGTFFKLTMFSVTFRALLQREIKLPKEYNSARLSMGMMNQPCYFPSRVRIWPELNHSLDGAVRQRKDSAQLASRRKSWQTNSLRRPWAKAVMSSTRSVRPTKTKVSTKSSATSEELADKTSTNLI